MGSAAHSELDRTLEVACSLDADDNITYLHPSINRAEFEEGLMVAELRNRREAQRERKARKAARAA